MRKRNTKHWKNYLLLMVNISLVAVIVHIFLMYRFDYEQKLYAENLNNIININQSAANISSEFFQGQKQNMDNILHYQRLNGLNRSEFLEYLYQSNASDEYVYELIGTDDTGVRIGGDGQGKYEEVSYEHEDYAQLHKIFENPVSESTEAAFSAEFTDNYTAFKSFAMYIYLTLEDASGQVNQYTLMGVTKTSDFAESINLGPDYDSLKTALINKDGDYIVSNADYKTSGFYEYLYQYNNLTLDQMNSIKHEVTAAKDGYVRYKNGSGNDSVFVYARIPESSWYTVTQVEVADFHNTNFDIRFTLFIIGILLLLMCIDLVWMAELNRRLRVSAAAANKANAAKTDFLSSMSHDIRTPLNVINGMTELALDENNSDITTGYLENIHSSGRFLLGLVNDILDLNKVESGKMELHERPYHYQELKRYLQAVIQPLCKEKQIDLEITSNEEQMVVMVDELRLNQIFFNLLSNAVKFTTPGGRIVVDTQVKMNEETPDRAHITFSVMDNGRGMSKSFQDHMFEAFTQENRISDTEVQGTGLGLAIVYKIVQLMDGSIAVDSQEGAGTTFTVDLDVALTMGVVSEEEKEYDEGILAGRRVLLCEDHPLNTQIVVKLLENKGILVDCAENGAIGLDLYQAAAENYYSAILMDIRMPVLDGLKTTAAIRGLKSRTDATQIPIIALTANAYDTDVENSFAAGANAHLAKPIDSKRLYQTLARLIGNYSF